MTKKKSERKSYKPIYLNHDEEFFARLAGFIEGDGSFGAQLKRMKGYKYGWQIYTSVQLTQKESERSILDFYYQELGMTGFTRVREEKKTFFNATTGEPRPIQTKIADFIISAKQDLIPLLEKLIPHLKLKKKQAELLLEICKKQNPKSWNSVDEFISVCKLTDELSLMHGTPSRKNDSAKVIQWLKDNGKLPKDYLDSP